MQPTRLGHRSDLDGLLIDVIERSELRSAPWVVGSPVLRLLVGVPLSLLIAATSRRQVERPLSG